MSDDFLNKNTSNTPEDDDTSASAIFAEMMRQAAARQTKSTTDMPESESDESHTDNVERVDHQTSAQKPPSRPRKRPLYEADLSDEEEQTPLVPESLQSDTLQDEDKLAEAMEKQRVQRIKRRKERRRRNAVGVLGGFLRTVFVMIISAGLVATILTWFLDPQFLNPTVVRGLQSSSAGVLLEEMTTQPTDVPAVIATPNWLQRIGIVAGHRGPENDPGAVCPDGLTETEINFNVAQQIVTNLRARNYSVDLLDEFDPRLDNYQAAALVSIHSNTCQDFGERVSGYMVAKAASRPDGGIDSILAECIAQKYEELVPLERRFTLTEDMTDYHTFREIHPLTPAAIMELGFMLADRQLLEDQPDLLAQAITNGVLCFLEPSSDYPVLPSASSENLPDNFVPIATETPTTP